MEDVAVYGPEIAVVDEPDKRRKVAGHKRKESAAQLLDRSPGSTEEQVLQWSPVPTGAQYTLLDELHSPV